MKNKIKSLLLALGVAFSFSANAWVISTDATVDQVWEWQDSAPVYFRLSSGSMCYVPNEEKSVYSLILSLWATGKKATFHCWDTEENTQGILGHRIHRVVATR
jgi:hypothetical protein